MIERGVFKANDIRGKVGVGDAEWDCDGARAVGVAFVEAFELAGQEFVLGRDTRHQGLELSRAFADGAMSRGANVIDIGLSATDQLWYASGVLGVPGVQFTASHNPSCYNGIKFCQAQASPISPQLMARITELTYAQSSLAAVTRGQLRTQDLLAGYAAKLHSLVDLSDMRRLTVVVDAGNGMAGLTTPAVFDSLNVNLVGLYTELDGDFPNHPPNPLDPANLVAAQAAVRTHQADLGLVFDGDADRCFIIDQNGDVVSPSIVTALIARAELRREPGAAIVVNTITSRTVAEVVEAAGGKVVVSSVGHTLMKAQMAAHHAIFGGEHSAHYYFRDFWGADTGMLAALHVLSLVGRASSMSALAAQLPHYAASGEINSRVDDPRSAMHAVAEALGHGANVSWTDGLLISADDWWLSVRESNTEPLLRLNVEAHDQHTVDQLRDDALALIRKE